VIVLAAPHIEQRERELRRLQIEMVSAGLLVREHLQPAERAMSERFDLEKLRARLPNIPCNAAGNVACLL
jgi:hypothetical protein